jgi:hypothetical protein
MTLKKQVEAAFEPLIGQKAWGASIGWGSFATIEFGARRLVNHHYHGDWHLWLYMCEWQLYSRNRVLANSESTKHVMEVATDNLNGEKLKYVSFDSERLETEFTFSRDLRLVCKPYADAASNEECWMLFRPDATVMSLRNSGLHSESQVDKSERSVAKR